jgi:hypothetical protein
MLRNIIRGLGIALLVVLTFSCKKDPVEVGLGIQPDEDMIGVYYSDTTTILAYSEANDSVRSDETVLSLAGSYFDPVFGTATAGFFTQFLLSSNSTDFGFTPSLDSLVISLAYAGYYGDEGDPVTLRVYEVTDKLEYDSVYYSHNILNYDPVEIASFTFVPNTKDSVMIDSVMYPPHIRLNLSAQNPAFAEKILQGSELQLADNENFVEFIKGLYITADPVSQGGSILYFNLNSSLSKINLHYSNINYDSLTYSFVLGGECARFNRFDHGDYLNADPVLKEQLSAPTVEQAIELGNDKLYLQSMQGININFRLPYLESWNHSGRIAITRAELVLPVLDASGDYPEPSKLLLGTYDEEGELVQIIDNNEGASFLGGTYDSTRTEYRFRITRHLQQILNGTEENRELVLLVSSRSVQGNRAIIGGPGRISSAMRLELIYVPVE